MVASVLPPNATAQERGLELATARLGELAVGIGSLWDPARCPAALLPWLAWALSIDSWSPDWPEATKRQRIARAIEIQRHKGTLSAVRAIVQIFGGAIGIEEWWQQTPRGTPHTFRLTLQLGLPGGLPPSPELIEDAIGEIRRVKPVRSHFDFVLGIDALVREGLKAVARPCVYARLNATAPAIVGAA